MPAGLRPVSPDPMKERANSHPPKPASLINIPLVFISRSVFILHFHLLRPDRHPLRHGDPFRPRPLAAQNAAVFSPSPFITACARLPQFDSWHRDPPTLRVSDCLGLALLSWSKSTFLLPTGHTHHNCFDTQRGSSAPIFLPFFPPATERPWST